MRVLHVSAGNLYGGVETVLVTLARGRALSHTVRHEFALCHAGRAEDELRAAGATVHRLAEVRVRWPLTVPRARRALRGLIEQRGINVVICHSAWPQAIFGPAVRAAGVASVFWLHDVMAGRHWLERWAARALPDLAICNSRFTAATLPLIYPRAPWEVCYTPVAAPPYSSQADREAVRAELETAADAVVVIQVSRMEEWKGHRLHLNALARLNSLPGWTCWFVGGAQRPHEARYLEGLRAEATALGIGPRVRFLGERNDISRLLAAADIHCQPNTGPEPFGITFIEALYAGLPVVTTAIGGALEIVDGSCGMLVQPGDPATLASAVGELIENCELRARLGAGGPVRAAALCDSGRQMARLDELLGRFTSSPHTTLVTGQCINNGAP